MMIFHADVGYAQKGEGDYGDVSPVPLGSKESHDPSRWLRAKSLHSIMNEDKMNEMKCSDKREVELVYCEGGSY